MYVRLSVSVCSTAEKFAKSQRLVHKLSQSNIDAMFPSGVTLLPPDIARQIDLESQAPDVDRYVILLAETCNNLNLYEAGNVVF